MKKESPVLKIPASSAAISFLLIERDKTTGKIIRYIGPFKESPSLGVPGEFNPASLRVLWEQGVINQDLPKHGLVSKTSIFEVSQMLNPDFVIANPNILESSDTPQIPTAGNLYFYGGHPQHFLRLWEEGYTEVAFGTGEWIGNKRVVAIWVFTGENREIYFRYYPKTRDADGSGRQHSSIEMSSNPTEFDKFRSDNKITMEEPTDLARLLRNWIRA